MHDQSQSDGPAQQEIIPARFGAGYERGYFMNKFDYVIIGGGLAGASAIQGIRERDTHGSILLVGEEKHL